ncbi:DEAD/DEAH box helicase [Pseudomonas aeruginosa]|uniref:DEAD/DEAH box helicase n=1 Tax=Pseudomonas aeruginosa TaxID=287 RepID=UPI003CED5FBD
MNPLSIVSQDPRKLLDEIVIKISSDGPVDQSLLEMLAYVKEFYPDVFSEYESKLMYVLGLFYKTDHPDDVLSLVYEIYNSAIKDLFRGTFTPVQASIWRKIEENKYFSFSAPTSAGKSHLLREIILNYEFDIVIVLPSRALISEYLASVRDIVRERKDILVLQFIDDVNKAKVSRRVFIITPERSSELFKYKDSFNVGLFVFDEAQVSEESVRGVTFDAMVRRVDKVFSSARKVFVHPFVENPEAQLKKHGFSGESYVYRQNVVGKIFIEHKSYDEGFYYFSPYSEDGAKKSNKRALNFDPIEAILQSKGSVLIFVSKAFIYGGVRDGRYKKYIFLCEEVSDPYALRIISSIEDIVGSSTHSSELVDLLRVGVVIHHGSVPLVVRTLLEEFANNGFSRICFATTTLAQGVNIPFDLIWIDNFRFQGSIENKTLGLKNLIGRAGRTTGKVDSFDYGYVVVSSASEFIKRYSVEAKISEVSGLDEVWEGSEDYAEFIDAVKEQTMNDEFGLPDVKVERVSTDEIFLLVSNLLDILYRGGSILSGEEYRELPEGLRNKIKSGFIRIYETSLGRDLTISEKSVLSTAMAIFLWHVQGKSFSSLLDFRYSYLSKRKEQRELFRKFSAKQITYRDYIAAIRGLVANYSPIPFALPDSKSSAPNRFIGVPATGIRYDILIYDTYDYLDKVIAFSLADVFIAAFEKYSESTQDRRAKSFSEYLRYGTNDPVAILLIRYGFSPESVNGIARYVTYIGEDKIEFSDEVSEVEDLFSRILIEHYS